MMRELFCGREDQLIRCEAVAAVRAARRLGCRVGVLTNDLTLFHDAEWVARVQFLTELNAVVDAWRRHPGGPVRCDPPGRVPYAGAQGLLLLSAQA